MRLYEFFDQPRDGMGFLGEKNVEEGNLDKFKKYIRPVVKTTPKIERTTNPAGRTNDHVEWKVTTPTGEIHRYKSKKQAQEHFDSFGSQGVTEGLESGPVEAYGYRYNNRDQRIVWRKIFPSGEAAYAWADRNNATVLGTRSTEQR